ncbi:MAG: LysM peptidoglycan-binding domain-containing protein [Chlamydiia bacterium]|nr:LysM peptidoglycan-binding domain-containing protein [Chlamydiia bacterium]
MILRSLRRALMLSGVVNVCALSWIFYSGMVQPSVQIVVPEQEEVQRLTMAERLEAMSLCDIEELKKVMSAGQESDFEEKAAAAYLLLHKSVREIKQPEVVAAAEPAPQVTRPPRHVAAPSTNLYLVRQGDSLWKIARQHQTDVNTLKALNALEGDNLRAGKLIKLPS